MALLARQAPVFELPTDPEYYAWSIQGQLRAIALSLMLISLITVLGRIYIRVVVLRVFRVDDYFIVLATVCSVTSTCIFLHVIKLGMGKHFFAVPPENILPLLMWIYIVAVFIPLALCFVKLSVAFFLLSLTRGTRYGRLCWVMVGFLTVFTVFTFFTLILGCIPIQANWDFSLRPPPFGTGTAKCLPIPAYRGIALANTITNIVTDVVLAVMPIPLIWSLQVNKRTKASLMLILGLGFFACAAGIYKAPLLYRFFDSMDSTGESAWYYAWQTIEMNTAILAAALPSLKPAFRWLLETAKNIATGANSGRGTRTSVLSPPGGGYKRQFSSGYLGQRDGGAHDEDESPNLSNSSGTYNATVVGPVTTISTYGKGEGMDSWDARDGKETGAVELRPIYSVSVAGKGTTGDERDGAVSVPNDEAGYGFGRVRSSSDAILRGEDLETGSPVVHEGQRGIFRTTEVTIVRG